MLLVAMPGAPSSFLFLVVRNLIKDEPGGRTHAGVLNSLNQHQVVACGESHTVAATFDEDRECRTRREVAQ